MLLVSEAVARHYVTGAITVKALDGVDFSVAGGETVAICGPSGSGKSTLLHLLGALDQPTFGTVRLDEIITSDLSEGDRALLRRRTFGFVFQQFQLLATLSAAENVALPLILDGCRPPAAITRAAQVLERVGLAAKLNSRPGALSGGEQQRVAIARALVANPMVVFADEPTAALDRSTGTSVLEILVGATTEVGSALVVVSHDPAVAAAAHRRVDLLDGRVAASHVLP